MKHNRIKDLLKQESITQPQVNIKGWVKTARHSKEFSFLDISDGSCFHDMQVVASESLENYKSEISKLKTGCSVSIHGTLVESPGKEQKYEIQASKIEVVGWVDDDYPLQKKRHSFEFLRTIAHLRGRTNTLGAMLRVRNAAARAIHNFFQEKGFIYLHAPIITASDCEGAGQMFRVSVLDPKNPPLTENGNVDFSKDFFGKQSFLTVSGQLEGETAALALSNIYTFGPTFRAENSNTARHVAEFWMIEPEMAFCDIFGNMDMAEEFLKYIAKSVWQACPDDLQFFQKMLYPDLFKNLEGIIQEPFARITYTEAIDILLKSQKTFEYPIAWGKDMQSEHERFLTEECFKKPVIVTDYPKDIKAFYMYLNDDNKTVRGMDVLVPKTGEVIGGSQREDRIDVLKKRMEEMHLSQEAYWWYLDLRRYGSVPHAGFGMGFERFILFITGIQNIREAIPFPRVPGYAEF
ncbi:MAG: asparagine--tRNA ligase [Candidatus Brocadiae bacterium]|nr:asparagine--tRNA ligase [Candidatus Brocadiia bacterium]